MTDSLSSSIAKAVDVFHLSRRDAELLMMHIISINRAALRISDNLPLTATQAQQYQALVLRRAQGEPLAYITGQREFWSLPFAVNPDVLIPRPETEIIVEKILAIKAESAIKLLELGTGSGAIAISIGFHRPHWNIIASDISQRALQLARKNAKNLEVNNIQFCLSDWFTDLNHLAPWDIIVSNPPYIAENDPHLEPEVLQYEPKIALLAPSNGLAALRQIIESSPHYLHTNGMLLLEHGFMQADKVRDIFKIANFQNIQTIKDFSQLSRVTIGEKK